MKLVDALQAIDVRLKFVLKKRLFKNRVFSGLVENSAFLMKVGSSHFRHGQVCVQRHAEKLDEDSLTKNVL